MSSEWPSGEGACDGNALFLTARHQCASVPQSGGRAQLNAREVLVHLRRFETRADKRGVDVAPERHIVFDRLGKQP